MVLVIEALVVDLFVDSRESTTALKEDCFVAAPAVFLLCDEEMETGKGIEVNLVANFCGDSHEWAFWWIGHR